MPERAAQRGSVHLARVLLRPSTRHSTLPRDAPLAETAKHFARRASGTRYAPSMTGHVQSVLEQAKRLTAEERVDLARELLASVDEDEESGSQAELDAAWDVEIRRRDEQVLRGEGGAHDAEAVLAEAERLIRSER